MIEEFLCFDSGLRPAAQAQPFFDGRIDEFLFRRFSVNEFERVFSDAVRHFLQLQVTLQTSPAERSLFDAQRRVTKRKPFIVEITVFLEPRDHRIDDRGVRVLALQQSLAQLRHRARLNRQEFDRAIECLAAQFVSSHEETIKCPTKKHKQHQAGRREQGQMMDGLLVIDKPTDLTSHDVVARVRHILHERRIGHTGTLDPFATGVLVLLLGKATRLAQFFNEEDKEYDAIIRLGYATDTGDRTGTPIDGPKPTQLGNWDEQKIEEALGGLRGWIDQVPPMYSAKKREGKKLYELARRGEQVDRQPVRVCVHEFTAIKPDGLLFKNNLDGTFDFRARVVCSSGTYVRTLAEDFGKRLSVGAHLAELRRTRVGDFNVESAITLDDLKTSFAEEALGELVVPPSAALSKLALVHLSGQDVRNVMHGREVSLAGSDWADGENVKLCDAGEQLIAIGRYNARRQVLHPHVVLREKQGFS